LSIVRMIFPRTYYTMLLSKLVRAFIFTDFGVGFRFIREVL